MQLVVKSVFDIVRVSTAVRVLSRGPLGAIVRVVDRLRGGAAPGDEGRSLRAEFGRPARVEEDLT
jgi:hypothetical protein